MPARPSTAIVTDTTACIPPELIDRYGIEVVPLTIVLGGRTFTDAVSDDTSAFYALLRDSNGRATTSAPSPGTYMDAIARAAGTADSVLCITVSAQFSAMYDSARQAIEMLRARGVEASPVDVRLLDSRNAAMAQGFVVIEAARAAAGGASIEGVVARAEAMSQRVSLLAMLDTLTFLARSGRVPKVAAWAAGMLQVKPIVRFGAGGIKLAGRGRTRARALDRLVDLFAEDVAGRAAHVAVHHANAPADAAFLLRALQARVNVAEAYVSEFTQVMGVHTGPGLAGLAFWTEDEGPLKQHT